MHVAALDAFEAVYMFKAIASVYVEGVVFCKVSYASLVKFDPVELLIIFAVGRDAFDFVVVVVGVFDGMATGSFFFAKLVVAVVGVMLVLRLSFVDALDP